MDVVETLSRVAAAAEAAWLNAADGPDKEVMREVADALREVAQAKLQAKQPEGAALVQSLVVHLVESPDEP